MAPAVVDWKITRGTAPRDRRGDRAGQRRDAQRDRSCDELPFKTGDPLDPEALQRGQDRSTSSAPIAASAVQAARIRRRTDRRMSAWRSCRARPAASSGAPATTRATALPASARSPTTTSPIAPAGITLRGAGQRHPRRSVADAVPRRPRLPRAASSSTRAGSGLPELIGERSTKTIDQFSVLRGSVGNGVARDLLPRLKGGAELQVERADTFNVQPQCRFSRKTRAVVHDRAVAVPDLRRPQRSVRADQRRLRQRSACATRRRECRRSSSARSTCSTARRSRSPTGCRSSTSRASATAAPSAAATVLPIRERYFLGGSTTVRGFSENSLGPVDVQRAQRASAATWRWC